VLILATTVLLLPHVPPVIASVRVMVLPAQTAAGPVMVPASGAGLTVMDEVVVAVPQALVTV
jgi:hypothetical protein